MAAYKDAKLIKLDGTVVRTDGSSYKSNFFKFLDINPDDESYYSNVTYTPEQAKRIRNHLQHMSTGASSAVPMYCAGEKCIIADRCPLLKEDRRARKEGIPNYKPITPIGLTCLVEKNLLVEWTRLYIESFNVQENAFIDIKYCQDLAEIELLLWRMNNVMAKPENAGMVQEDIAGVDRQGNLLTKKSINSLFEAREKLLARKSRTIKLLVGDRQEQYKREAALKMRDTSDPSTQTAKLRNQLEQLKKQASKIDLQLKEAEGDIIDVKEESESHKLTPEDLINQGSDG